MWQVVAIWLAVGAVIIWLAAKQLRRYMFRDNNPGRRDAHRNRNNRKPPCCG